MSVKIQYSKTPEYHKEYYEKNKEKILASMNRIKHCDICDKDVKFCRWSKHCQGKKHKELSHKIMFLNPDDNTKLKELIQRMDELKTQVEEELNKHK